MTKTNTKTKTNTFWEHLLRAILETCDLWDICSEWWEDMTWPKKITKTNTKTKTMTKTKTFWEPLLRAILETCDLWDICSEWWEDMTRPKKIDKDKYKDKDKDKYKVSRKLRGGSKQQVRLVDLSPQSCSSPLLCFVALCTFYYFPAPSAMATADDLFIFVKLSPSTVTPGALHSVQYTPSDARPLHNISIFCKRFQCPHFMNSN